MLSLTNELPQSITFEGIEYRLDMSYDNVLLLYEMLSDKRLSDATKIVTGVNLLFEEPPEAELDYLLDLWNYTFKTLIHREESESVAYDIKGNPMPKVNKQQGPIFDFKEDANYIYASFFQDYNIDLIEQKGKLHWYKFQALLNGLSDSTRLRKVIEIRQMELPKGPGTEEQRKKIQELKDYYALKKGDED